MSQESVSVKAKQRRRHTTFPTLPPVIGQTAIYPIPMQSWNSRTDHEMSRQSMTIISNHSFNSNPSHAVSVNSSILSHAMAIPTILTIPLQSSILLQSQCNYSTNVPEYIELGGRPGTSVHLLRFDCRITPQTFQDLSTQSEHVFGNPFTPKQSQHNPCGRISIRIIGTRNRIEKCRQSMIIQSM